MTALKDPSSDIAQQLLSSERLLNGLHEPWWARQSPGDDLPKSDKPLPTLITIPEAMLTPTTNRPLLVYNIAYVWWVYTALFY